MTIEPNLLSSEERDLQRLARLYQEVRRLYAWLGLLSGLCVLSIGLMGAMAVSLMTQQNQLQRQLPFLADQAEIDRVKHLENRLNNVESQASILNQNVGFINEQVSQGLPSQLKGIKTDMNKLQTSATQFCRNIKY